MRRTVLAFSMSAALLAATAGPAAANTLTPTSYDFGLMATGTTSTPVAFLLTANTEAAQPRPGTTGGLGSFAVTTTNCPGLLPMGSSCTINVAFNPAGLGDYTGTLASNSTSPQGTTANPIASLRGTGVPVAATKPKKCKKKKKSAAAAKKKCKKKGKRK